jgi:hypothetical protein
LVKAFEDSRHTIWVGYLRVAKPDGPKTGTFSGLSATRSVGRYWHQAHLDQRKYDQNVWLDLRTEDGGLNRYDHVPAVSRTISTNRV